MSDAPTLPSAIGAYVADTRRERGLTLDQVAQAGRSYGARWSASSVSNIERGQASMTMSTMVVLALALGDLLDRPLALTDLLGDAQLLSLVSENGRGVTREWLDSVLSGAQVVLDAPKQQESDIDLELNEVVQDEALRRMRESGEQDVMRSEKQAQFDQMLEESQMPPERFARARTASGAPTLAEERAAKKLGVDSYSVRRRALELWGHSIDDESASRAGVDSTPQARGRMTRVLVDELRAAMGEVR